MSSEPKAMSEPKGMRRFVTVPLLALAVAAVGCRGGISESPPIHPVLDMDFQQKLKAQSQSEFEGWKDHRGMRLPVAHTVKRRKARQQYLAEHPELTTYKNADGTFVTANPVPPTVENLERGRQKFWTFCAPCHGRTGQRGLVASRWPTPIPNLATDERIKGLPHGDLYNTVANSKGLMPSYAKQIDPEDTWRIVHFLKTLQTID